MGQVAGFFGLTPNMGAAAMAMLIARTEPNHFIGGFATKFVELKISVGDRLDAAMKKCQQNFGGTDTTVAIEYAQQRKYAVDAFVVITDGETWAGDLHTSQALESYRRKTGLNTKLIVINMVANRTRITDPTDAGSLDIVGFDTSMPTVMHAFLGGTPEFPEEEAA
jgi:60 kDa SS-A/Ro ribonucleoprotein